MSLEATSDLWWKNTIVYCVDVQAFLDSTGDGIGDLDGLTQRIDYLAGIGITCLWLMPVYPSPERDHGYDVADYYGVAAEYGSLGDLVELVRTARERGIRVIADLVVNHTSIDIKNHDEATLDKLVDAERDEVFAAFAPDESMRMFGRGIRRRFPSMVGGDRRRIEHAYSLLFSLPGTPVLLYGEEIGLGENLDLEGRVAVRAPMQWSDDSAAGFSAAPESELARAPVRDGPFGYRQLNVERQRENPDSLLNWMERAIRVRKEWPELGWGDWEVLETEDDAVLAHLATWDGGSVLAVHNFADRPARVRTRLPPTNGEPRWRHLFGSRDGEVPRVDGRIVDFELRGYGYHWFGRREGVWAKRRG